MHAGYHAWLPQEATEAREEGANLNPVVDKRATATTEPEYTCTPADASPPARKDDAFMRQAAIEGDADTRAGKRLDDPQHAYKRLGVKGSHPFQKLTYARDPDLRQPDPMHTTGNELKGLADMAKGGTGANAAYGRSKLETLAAHKMGTNDRFHDSLGPFLKGKAS